MIFRAQIHWLRLATRHGVDRGVVPGPGRWWRRAGNRRGHRLGFYLAASGQLKRYV